MSEKIDNQTFFNSHPTPSWVAPPIVIAWKLSSAENLGALLRVCDNFGIKEAFFVGMESDYKASRIKRNATTSYNKVDWSFISEIDLWKQLPQGITKIAVDTTSKSIPIQEFDFNELNTFCLLFGNETIGLESEIITMCNTSIHVPMIGESFSMNVVNSATAVLYEGVRQCLLNK